MANPEDLSKIAVKLFSEQVADLLSTKHLYQNVEVDPLAAKSTLELMAKHAARPPVGMSTYGPSSKPASATEIEADLSKSLTGVLRTAKVEFFAGTLPAGGVEKNPLWIKAPTVKLFCQACKSREPFKALSVNSWDEPKSNSVLVSSTFVFSYLCQHCDSSTCRIMMTRKGPKLQILGISPVQRLDVPKYIPKSVDEYYSDSVVVSRTGKVLAAAFFLRVLIEQFWREYLGIKDVRKTGDEMGADYAAHLPQEFRSLYPSLSEGYEKLSAGIHAAKMDIDVFEEVLQKVEKHFEARRLTALPKTAAKTGPGGTNEKSI